MTYSVFQQICLFISLSVVFVLPRLAERGAGFRESPGPRHEGRPNEQNRLFICLFISSFYFFAAAVGPASSAAAATCNGSGCRSPLFVKPSLSGRRASANELVRCERAQLGAPGPCASAPRLRANPPPNEHSLSFKGN